MMRHVYLEEVAQKMLDHTMTPEQAVELICAYALTGAEPILEALPRLRLTLAVMEP